jgi:hypothetical protein
VNAAEDPASSAYVPIELEILGWIGRPVILLLNQSGPARSREVEAAEEQAWRRQLATFPEVRGALTLDAFARCWVQEDRLFSVLEAAVEPDKLPGLQRLRDAWRARNLRVFEQSVEALAEELAAVLADREPLSRASDESRAVAVLAVRAQAAARKGTDRLIAAHGLAGHARQEIPRRVAEQFDVKRPADVAKAGILGGAVSGLLGGLKADLATGGASLGAGAIIGALIGALGVGGAAHVWNVARGKEAAAQSPSRRAAVSRLRTSSEASAHEHWRDRPYAPGARHARHRRVLPEWGRVLGHQRDA